MKKKTLIIIILSFPITLTVYVFLFADNIKFEEEIVINANIDSIALILSNPSKIDNYMPGVEKYSLKKGDLGKKGAVAEIKLILKEMIFYLKKLLYITICQMKLKYHIKLTEFIIL